MLLCCVGTRGCQFNRRPPPWLVVMGCSEWTVVLMLTSEELGQQGSKGSQGVGPGCWCWKVGDAGKSGRRVAGCGCAMGCWSDELKLQKKGASPLQRCIWTLISDTVDTTDTQIIFNQGEETYIYKTNIYMRYIHYSTYEY